MKLSVIVPVLNEASTLAAFLQHLQPLREMGHQLIVVDGGSCDQSFSIAEPLCDLVLHSGRGRAKQMNTGATQADGDWLLFLHADTHLPQPLHYWCDLIESSEQVWGRFDVSLSGRKWYFRVIETCMNWRSALTAIATGDQAIFVRQEQFVRLRGFAEMPLMEDVELSRRLGLISPPLRIKQSVRTSSRRWEERGVFRTIWLMWDLRLRYFFGASPVDLERRYYPSNKVTQR